MKKESFIERLLSLPFNRTFFLFGARNTGKSSLLHHVFQDKGVLWIDLLNPEEEERYIRNPMSLKQEVLALEDTIHYIVIDEIQKVPALLNVIHHLIETTKKIFILTGSSARKLKYGGANLLAGRAFVYHLFPFTSTEIGADFSLENALLWGTLPTIVYGLSTNEEKAQFLRAYTQTYLKEEIWMEHFIRKITPFRKFLEVAAETNGQIVNYANLSRDVGVDDKTIKQYFSILEDTLMGFMLEPYETSVRKSLRSKPKFYFFDSGVCRALTRTLSIPLREGSSEYGRAFEHFIILECLRLASYHYPDYRFSYLRTKSDVEIDLIIERPGQKTLLIEIKSSTEVRWDHIQSFSALSKDMTNVEPICLSRSPRAQMLENILILPWGEGLKRYFMPGNPLEKRG